MEMILIHGLGQTADSWTETINMLSAETDVLCPRLSDFYGKGGYDEMYRGFSEYLDNISQPLYLCGLSLGAVLALNYALDHPKRVRGLALAAPQFRMPKTLLRFPNAVFRLLPQKAFIGSGLT